MRWLRLQLWLRFWLIGSLSHVALVFFWGHDLLLARHAPHLPRLPIAHEHTLGFGRIVVSEAEAPNLFANLV